MLTKLQKKALQIAPTLSRDGPFTCTMLGEALFAETRFSEWSVYHARWKPLIVEILKVRVERLQDITLEDVKAEGIEAPVIVTTTNSEGQQTTRKIDGGLLNLWGYEFLWNKLYGEGSWNKNPWVWVLEFKRLAS